MDRNTEKTDLHQCREVINGIDNICQVQLGQIEATITTALRAMETPQFWEHPLQLKGILEMVQYIASDLGNFVNGSAETVGSNYVDDVDRARESRVLAAFRATRQQEACNV